MQRRKLPYVPGLISLVALPIILLIWHPEDPVRKVGLRIFLPTDDARPTPENAATFSRYSILQRVRNKKITRLDFWREPYDERTLYGNKARLNIIYREIEKLTFIHDTTSVLQIELGEGNTYADFINILNYLAICRTNRYALTGNTLYVFANDPPTDPASLASMNIGPVDFPIDPFPVSEGPSTWEIWKWRFEETLTITKYMLKHYPIILTGFIVLIVIPAILKMANFAPKPSGNMKTSFLILSALLIASASNAFAASSPVDTMLNTPAPEFTLKDINGKTVTLADYKGKVLIIDFWATWCGPCKSSFPSVKKVMEKYKNDPNVSFLFIDTREKEGNYPELVKKFLADNKYPFHVVFDEKGEEGKMDVVYKKYVMPGIPTKYIIDAKGIIRYQIIGFMPGKTDEDAAKEFTEHIEAVKKIS